MNINELEKLARAATTDPVYPSDLRKLEDFQDAANPAAILELIDRYKSVIRSLEAAANYIDTLDGNSLGIRQTISRANGESSV